MPDKAVQIIERKSGGSFQLKENALREILEADDVREREIVIISVAGAYRQGKSFLLSFFLRYLHSKYLGEMDFDTEWLGQEDKPLSGFSWRAGATPETSGIWMWSELFKYDTRDGRKLAIALMDTQGTFDSESTMEDNAIIFALSAMLSSVLIYNITGNIQEDHLQHLQYFTEYGKLAMEEGLETPFQHLQFLIRDWRWPQDHPFGAEGGQALLDKRLAITSGQKEELQKLRQHIRSCFSRVSCFLMPEPGKKVTRDTNFKGCVKDIDEEFVDELKVFVPLILKPDQLIIKKINRQFIKCGDLVEYFVAYAKAFNGKSLPKPRTVFEATAEANNFAAVTKTRQMYVSKMEEWFCKNTSYEEPNRFQSIIHETIKAECMKHFDEISKMGGKEFSIKFRAELEAEIKVMLMKYMLQNEQRNDFKNQATFDGIKQVRGELQGHDWLRHVPVLNAIVQAVDTVLGVIGAGIKAIGSFFSNLWGSLFG